MGAVAPAWGLLSGLGYAGWSQYIAIAIAKASSDAGIKAAIKGVKGIFDLGNVPGVNFEEVVNSINCVNKDLLAKSLYELSNTICATGGTGSDKTFCTLKFTYNEEARFIKNVTKLTTKVAEDAGAAATEAKDVALANATNATHSFNIAIIASVVAIVVIVLIMVIIYLILRYRRKKKMKKKLQYIKLLEE
ncbi:hypothetical protein PFTANZ_05939 [Plasmodium falciparum Tanzania (2000708)]|uniref:Surface antigen n=1 Tax=Plasmodium falciparum Tanzania (2000708) TaxID=1036725 RepID=A0A024VZM1_PLAFA|nr:hypothetical protein PFTANZ_05939 [Plasmodium falciparum Tanzania (2000708)]